MGKQGKILIVDDTEMNRSMLADMLQEDYEILEAENGLEAAKLLYQLHDGISLVLLDIIMPEMDGFEVLTLMSKNDWIERIPVITISSETASAYIDHAYDLGATDYISRPFDEKTVQRRVRNTIMLYSKQKALESLVAEQIVEKEQNNFLMVEILSNIVEFRNGESGLHVLHIRILTEILLRKLQEITDRYPLTAAQIALIVNASALHDVGKISIPEEILNKPGRLTEEEFGVVKGHVEASIGIIKHLPSLDYVIPAVTGHHERYDGGGYPRGIAGENIPLTARILCVADSFDAMVSKRCYKPGIPLKRVMEILREEAGKQFDPRLVEAFLSLLASGRVKVAADESSLKDLPPQ